MPESKRRDAADAKKKAAREASLAEKRAEKKRGSQRLAGPARWVVPTMITLMLLGVAWLVVWYLTAATGIYVPWMSDIGNWNLAIVMGLMAASFAVATQWK